MSNVNVPIAACLSVALLFSGPAGASSTATSCFPKATDDPHHYYWSFLAYYRVELAETEDKRSSATEATSKKRVCGACTVGEVYWVGESTAKDAVIPDARGGVHVLDTLASAGRCLVTTAAVEAVDGASMLFTVSVEERALNCGDDTHVYSDRTRVHLLDLKTSSYLLVLDSDAVEVTGDLVVADACGKDERRFSLKKLRHRRGFVPPPLLQLKKTFQGLLLQGRKLTRSGHHEHGIRAYRAALKLEPSSGPAMAELGYVLYLAGWLAEAERCLKRALSLRKEDHFQAAAYFNLGLTHERQGRPKLAMKAFRRSHAIRPTKATKQRLRR